MRCGISSALLERLVRDAEAAGPIEICGLLLGEPGLIAGLAPVTNAHPEPGRGFALDPAGHVQAARAAREAGKTVVGHYHSHPSGNARPSQADAARAQEQDVYWMIVGAGEARLWISRRGGSTLGSFDPIELALS
jgi:proteasome lid subunit RPN8/RPN11